jgi:hypothetical protein
MPNHNLSVENERLLLQTCMGITSSETLFIMHTPRRKSEALRFVEAGRNLGLKVTSEAVSETLQKSDKLPGPVMTGFSSASVILLLVSGFQNQIFGHHPVKDQAVERGARIGFVTIPIGEFDPKKTERIAHVSRSMGQLLTEAKEAYLTSSLGTDIWMDLTGRKAVSFTNFLREPGAWGALPDYAETAIPPIEGSTQGTLIVDGTIIGVGLLTSPIQLDIQNGKIIRFDTTREAFAFKSLLEKGEGEIFSVAELGLGVNEFVTQFDGSFEDKKILGSGHFGIGGNLDLGGRLASTVHLDVILRKVSLQLDGKWLLRDGKLAQKI